jgi:lipid-binding SYLF domain-containing protein
MVVSGTGTDALKGDCHVHVRISGQTRSPAIVSATVKIGAIFGGQAGEFLLSGNANCGSVRYKKKC